MAGVTESQNIFTDFRQNSVCAIYAICFAEGTSGTFQWWIKPSFGYNSIFLRLNFSKKRPLEFSGSTSFFHSCSNTSSPYKSSNMMQRGPSMAASWPLHTTLSTLCGLTAPEIMRNHLNTPTPNTSRPAKKKTPNNQTTKTNKKTSPKVRPSVG